MWSWWPRAMASSGGGGREGRPETLWKDCRKNVIITLLGTQQCWLSSEIGLPHRNSNWICSNCFPVRNLQNAASIIAFQRPAVAQWNAANTMKTVLNLLETDILDTSSVWRPGLQCKVSRDPNRRSAVFRVYRINNLLHCLHCSRGPREVFHLVISGE